MAGFDDFSPVDGQAGLQNAYGKYRLTHPSAWMICGALLFLVLATRFISGRRAESVQVNDTTQTVPAVPYWLPFLGHIPSMATDADRFVKGLRTSYAQGIFALNFGGTRHNVMYTPGLATALLNQKHTFADSDKVARGLMQSVFGFPAQEMDKYDAALADLMTCYKYLTSDPELGDMVRRTADRLRVTVKDLVTFNDSVVDQMQWERSSDVRITKDKRGKQVMEASLLPLIRDYTAHTANPAIMGTDFLANFPEFFDHMWNFDRGFLLLATGLPRWAPIPMLTRAHIARKRLLDTIGVYHEAMEKEANGEDPGPKWTSLDDAGKLVQARMEVYRKHKLSIRARASLENSLMWASNANSDMLVFWMINRIYADKALLEMIREEIAPFAQLVEPEQEFKVDEPPRFESFDVEGLCNQCPLLKSCYVECLRLDTASWSLKVVQQDFVLQSRDKEERGWLLRKGDYAHAAHDLHNTDPKHFQDPLVFKADRHIKEDDDKKKTADLGSIRPYGGGTSMCKGRVFAFKECMMFTAAIVSMWEIESAGGGPWKMPRHRKATGVYGTSDNPRVWLRRRVLEKPGTIDANM
ncbi:Hypothetical protein R9X50_00184100 [Acrodontium crateriforme]|uniref:Cytochrome P450 n=1 Tax=Acrodontium crateriforme TaxID=150365 RepID=A0AAQ3LZP4_9PEZI|nr:Hypothetical protein R9X50_00184100 [Acrodontium crateriforme]